MASGSAEELLLFVDVLSVVVSADVDELVSFEALLSFEMFFESVSFLCSSFSLTLSLSFLPHEGV